MWILLIPVSSFCPLSCVYPLCYKLREKNILCVINPSINHVIIAIMQ